MDQTLTVRLDNGEERKYEARKLGELDNPKKDIMFTVIKEILEKNLGKRIESIWKYCSKNGMKVPYTVDEAGFNTMLVTAINEYMAKNDGVYSFPVSEAFLDRNGNRKSRGDIVWYMENKVVYFELKISCFGSASALTDVNNSEKALRYAQTQLEGINPEYNESYYYRYDNDKQREDRKRFTCSLGMIQSIVDQDGRSNFMEIEESLQNSELEIFALKNFENGTALMTDGDKEFRNDGYFIVGKIRELKVND